MEKLSRKAIVFHADILGFKSIIEKAELEMGEETLHKIMQALQEATKILEGFNLLKEGKSKTEITYKLFSDNLYISFTYNEVEESSFGQAFIFAVLFARGYYSVMLDNQVPIRGAISFGTDYSNQHMIFSYALVKAYLLETEKANYPRVVLDTELFDKIRSGITIGGAYSLEFLNESFLKDEKGVYFLNPSGMEKELGVTEGGFTTEQLYKGFLKRGIDFSRGMYEQMQAAGEERISTKYKWLSAILMWYYFDKKIDCGYTFQSIKFGKIE